MGISNIIARAIASVYNPPTARKTKTLVTNFDKTLVTNFESSSGLWSQWEDASMTRTGRTAQCGTILLALGILAILSFIVLSQLQHDGYRHSWENAFDDKIVQITVGVSSSLIFGLMLLRIKTAPKLLLSDSFAIEYT